LYADRVHLCNSAHGVGLVDRVNRFAGPPGVELDQVSVGHWYWAWRTQPHFRVRGPGSGCSYFAGRRDLSCLRCVPRGRTQRFSQSAASLCGPCAGSGAGSRLGNTIRCCRWNRTPTRYCGFWASILLVRAGCCGAWCWFGDAWAGAWSHDARIFGRKWLV